MASVFENNGLDISQLVGSTNSWAIDLWRQGCANHWLPQEVSMNVDVSQWKTPGFLTEEEKLLVRRILGLFSAGESLVSFSIDFVEKKYILDGAAREYLNRKTFEESLHNFTVATCLDAYNLSKEEVAEAYLNIPTVGKMAEFLNKTARYFDDVKDTTSVESRRKFLENMVTFYLIAEGIWFFSSFASVLSLKRQNKLPGLGSQIIYTLRDESLHVQFGVNVLRNSMQFHPEIWTEEFKENLRERVRIGTELANEFFEDAVPKGLLGLNSNLLTKYNQFLADYRLGQIGLTPIYGVSENPLSWVNEVQEGVTMTAFFEARESNYQSSGMLEDDF